MNFDIVDTPNTWQFEKLSDGVWQRTDIRIAGATLAVGLDLDMSAFGEYLQTLAAVTQEKKLALGIPFDDDGGGEPFVPLISPKENFITQPDDSTEKTLTVHSFEVIPAPFDVIAEAVHYRVGTTPSTASILVEAFDQLSGVKYLSQVFSADTFSPADTEIVLLFDNSLEVFQGHIVDVVLSSDNAFSIKYNAAGTVPWSSGDVWFITQKEALLPHGTGTDRIIFSNEGESTANNLGNLVISNFISPPEPVAEDAPGFITPP